MDMQNFRYSEHALGSNNANVNNDNNDNNDIDIDNDNNDIDNILFWVI